MRAANAALALSVASSTAHASRASFSIRRQMSHRKARSISRLQATREHDTT
jgi:hypothetical protein